jgi:hypothetical protein
MLRIFAKRSSLQLKETDDLDVVLSVWHRGFLKNKGVPRTVTNEISGAHGFANVMAWFESRRFEVWPRAPVILFANSWTTTQSAKLPE